MILAAASDGPVDLGLLVLRLVFGLFLVAHGVRKVTSGIANTAGFFASIGMRWSKAQAVIAAITEIGAGLLFAAGLLSPLAAAGVLGVMSVAAFTHRKNGFFIFMPGQGWEYTVSIAATAAAVGIAGSGRWSLDHAVGLHADDWGGTWAPAVITLALGLGAAALQLATSYRPARPGAST